jgi:Tfp pilus assembly protein PilF
LSKAIVEEHYGITKSAVELRPNPPDAHLWLAWIARTTGAQRQGIVEMERGLQLAPNLLPAHVLLAELYYKVGNRAKAQAELAIIDRPTAEQQRCEHLEKFSLV